MGICPFMDRHIGYRIGIPIHKWKYAHLWTGTSVTELEPSMYGHYQSMFGQIPFMDRVAYKAVLLPIHEQ
jgi:hypothetical protein